VISANGDFRKWEFDIWQSVFAKRETGNGRSAQDGAGAQGDSPWTS
jgi:hypothetical protein